MAQKVHQGPHKYYRLQVREEKNRYRWRCVLPDCSHWLPHEMIVGKLCECWRCGEPFVIDKDSKLRKPHCKKCTRSKKDDKIEEALKEIEPSPI